MPGAVHNALPFGRYVGQDVVTIVDYDRRYTHWLLGQPWFEEKHPALFSAVRRRLVKSLAAEVEDERTAVERQRGPHQVLSAADLRAAASNSTSAHESAALPMDHCDDLV